MDINVEGMDELAKAMNSLPGLLGARVQGGGLMAAARVVRDEAKTIVPVRSGALQRSIRAGRRAVTIETLSAPKRVPGGAARVRAGGRGAMHAALAEYGTVRTAAQPYLEPALRSSANRQLTAAVAAMRKSFVNLGRSLAAGTATRLTRRLAAE